MIPQPIHWHEGMFLRPHHFQAAERFTARLVDQNTRFVQWHAWGYRRCVIDTEALGGFRFVVRELEARFRDGTVLSLPDDAPLPDVDLKPAFLGRTSLDLYLAIPVLRSGQPNVVQSTASAPARYRVHTLSVDDQNTGTNPQTVGFRAPTVRVLFGDDDRSGYELLPIAKLEKADRPEATPQMSSGFIPPILGCDAWPTFQHKILQDVYARLNKKIEVVANQVVSRRISFDSHTPGDAKRLHALARMNEGYAVLGHLGFAAGIHPIDAWTEFVRLIGQLSVFGRAVRPPQLPAYNHDDLGTGFWALKRAIDQLLNELDIEPAYQERRFVGSGLQMRVTLESEWLESGWQMYLGVRANVSQEECVKMLTRPERLGLKIGSSDRVDTIFTKGQEGLRFKHAPLPPRDLPSEPNLTYFEVSRESATNEWAHVQKMKTLAVRIQERDVIGSIDGQENLTIKTGNQSTTFSLTLYLVPAVK
jgi:type VI secretion system protein ImpJ